MRCPERKWIEKEIEGLDPATDTARIMALSTTRLLPRYGRAMVLNLLYCLGFLRASGELDGAPVVDRGGEGKIHRAPHRRAEDTVAYFAAWIQHGPGSDQGVASLQHVRQMHDHFAQQYAFSNETLIHGIALFTVQFEQLLELVGAERFSQTEKEAQLLHWRLIGEQLGVREMPDRWEGMVSFLDKYESSPLWYGPSPEGQRCAEALIEQFNDRWLPRGVHWAGRMLVLSLVADHVLRALELRKPPRPIVWLIRRALRALLLINDRLLWEPREPVDPTTLLQPRGAI